MVMSIEGVADSVHMIDAPYHGARGVLGTYLVRGDLDMLIDTGPASLIPGVLGALEKLGVDEVRIIGLTHIHLDHAAGCWVMLEAFPRASIHVHPRGAPHMVDPSKLEAAAREAFGDKILEYGEIRGVPAEKVKESVDGETLDLGGVSLRVVWTPGHSTHSQSYYEPRGRVLFIGDAGGHVFDDTLIPASPPPYNPVQALESLDRLIGLRPEIVCYSHFGYRRDAERRLRGFREQVELWTEVATEGVKEGLGLTQILGRLREEDPAVRRLMGSGEASERPVYASLVGFVEYAKWMQKKGEL